LIEEGIKCNSSAQVLSIADHDDAVGEQVRRATGLNTTAFPYHN
jgi:hypothetical protein